MNEITHQARLYILIGLKEVFKGDRQTQMYCVTYFKIRFYGYFLYNIKRERRIHLFSYYLYYFSVYYVNIETDEKG